MADERRTLTCHRTCRASPEKMPTMPTEAAMSRVPNTHPANAANGFLMAYDVKMCQMPLVPWHAIAWQDP